MLRKKQNKRNTKYFKKKQKYLHKGFAKWSLRQYMTNRELLSFPKALKIYKSWKLWRKPKLFRWRYFYTIQYKARILNSLKRKNWIRFKVFEKESYFWFKGLTKRQLFLKRKGILLNKKSKRKKRRNYIKLKRKFSKKNRFSLYKTKRKLINFNLIKIKNILLNYLKFIFYKNKYLLKINLLNNNYIKIFFNLQKIIFFFKHLRFYYRKLHKYFLIYKDLLINRRIIHVRSKWINKVKKVIKRKKRKIIKYKYINESFKFLAQRFFNLRKKFMLFFNYSVIRKQFFYLKIRTVDTNFFITITNYKHEVIIHKSTGQVSEERRKKIKLSPYTINNMVFDIIKKIKELKLKYIIIHINSRINRNIRNIFKILKRSLKLKIIKLEFSKPIPHHFGTKKARLRRL